MSLITISVHEDVSNETCADISEGIHNGMVSAGMSMTDRFHRVIKYSDQHWSINPYYPNLSSPRSNNYVLIEILIESSMGNVDKKLLLEAVAKYVSSTANILSNDIMTVLVEIPPLNWSYANGKVVDNFIE